MSRQAHSTELWSFQAAPSSKRLESSRLEKYLASRLCYGPSERVGVNRCSVLREGLSPAT